MKLVLLSAVLFFSINIYSQSYRNEYFGLIGECSYSEINLPAIRLNITYNVSKYQIVTGPVFSEIVGMDNTSHVSKSYLGLTGMIIGTKYYRQNSKKGGMYYFLDNMILNYRTYQHLFYADPNSKTISIIDGLDRSKLFFIQPMIGSGLEARFFRIMRFTFDLGVGFAYRTYKFDESYKQDIYPTSLFKYTFQLRTSLGVIL